MAGDYLCGMRVRWGEPPRVWVPSPVFSTLRRRTRRITAHYGSVADSDR